MSNAKLIKSIKLLQAPPGLYWYMKSNTVNNNQVWAQIFAFPHAITSLHSEEQWSAGRWEGHTDACD